MSKAQVAAALQIAGGASLTAAGFLVSTFVGLVAAGVLAIVFGIALEHEHEQAQPESRVDDGEREKRGDS